MTDQTFIMKVLKDKVVPQNTSYYTTSQNRDSVVTDYIFDFHVAKKKEGYRKKTKTVVLFIHRPLSNILKYSGPR